MPSLLLADSGSTKTDWCLLSDPRKPFLAQTTGINPYLQTPEEIISVMRNELQLNGHPTADKIVFYGAGLGSQEQKQKLSKALNDFFGAIPHEVESDLMAAARALCGDEPGIVSILGTGSNACYYDGKKIAESHYSLGYIAGDEGSGNCMGKKVLQHYAYEIFDEQLRTVFENKFGNELHAIVKRLYSQPFPNRLLATFVELLKENRGHPQVEAIVEEALRSFFDYNLARFVMSSKVPVYFTGSVSFEFKDVIARLCQEYGLELGNILKTPMQALIEYHQKRF